MNPQDKKKLLILGIVAAVGFPAAYFYSQSDAESMASEVASAPAPSPSTGLSTSVGSNVPSGSGQAPSDEHEPKFINISTATETLAAQIVAASPNQNEALLNEGVKQSSRLLNTMLQNKTLQVQVTEAELAIAKNKLEQKEIEKRLKDVEADATGTTDQLLYPPPIQTTQPTNVVIPSSIVDESETSVENKEDVDTIYDQFFVKGITSVDSSYTAICSFRGTSLVLRVGSMVNGKYKVSNITENTLTLERQGESFEFVVNI